MDKRKLDVHIRSSKIIFVSDALMYLTSTLMLVKGWRRQVHLWAGGASKTRQEAVESALLSTFKPALPL